MAADGHPVPIAPRSNPPGRCGCHSLKSQQSGRNAPRQGVELIVNTRKMPTGLVDSQEYVHEFATRELLEESGIDATMSGILCVRMQNGARQ